MTIDIRDVFGFKDEDINSAVSEDTLLSMEIEFSSRCNLRCLYCYTGKNLFRKDELELEEIFDVISQAKALGARKIIYLGAGEPLLDPKLHKTVKYVHKLGLDHILFTNSTLIDSKLATFFYDHNLSVVVKYKSQKVEVYDLLTGVSGSYESMKRGMQFLFEAGYPDEGHFLGIESIICKYNINEIPSIWRWARNKNIVPYIEYLTYAGLAVDNKDILFPEIEEMKKVFEELSHIDAKEYGIIWRPHPPIAGFSCKRHLYSCIVNSQGFVQPCVGIDIKLGNVKQEKLSKILKNSHVRQSLKRIRETIKEPCKTCDLSFDCYGCRGTAYNLTGDYLASDSTCWRLQK